MNSIDHKVEEELPSLTTGDEHAISHVYATIKQAFCTEYYLKRYPDIRESGVDPLIHYIRSGCREGRDPSPAFSTRYYLERYPDVLGSGLNPLFHFVRHGLGEGRRPVPLPASYRDEGDYAFVRSVLEPAFDAEFYRSQYPECERQILDPLDHFLLIGYKAGHDPSPAFSVNAYLQASPDVQASGVNPFYHFLVLGRMEGRRATGGAQGRPRDRSSEEERRVLEDEFDAEFYLHRYPDVRASGMDPLVHYIRFGWHEGRDPSSGFSTCYYLDANPDVRAQGFNPFYHYLTRGRQEGRSPVLPGGHVAKALYSLESLEQQVEGWTASELPEVELACSESLQVQLREFLASHEQRVIVSLCHDDYRTSVGGVQNCILLEEQAAMESGAVYINLHPVMILPVLSRAERLEDLSLVMVCNGQTLGTAAARNCLDALQWLAGKAGRVDLVVHALLGHASGFVRTLAETAVNGECLYWLHDFLSICPGYNLLRNGVRFCGAPDVDSMACSVCVYGEERTRQSPLLHDLFEAAGFTVLAPSAFAADLWQRRSGLPCRELAVVPHTRFAGRAHAANTREAPRDQRDGVLRIAYLGHPLFHKGWPVFSRLVQSSREAPGLEFHHLGASPARDVFGLRFTEVRVCAGNHDAMIEALLSRRIDLAFVWSIWPETYCLTAHEAVAAGVPVLTCESSGNVARMVAERDCGVVFSDEEELFAAFSSGEIRRMLLALRKRSSMQPSGLEYSGMSLERLGCQGGR
jgi:hypothetical protein